MRIKYTANRTSLIVLSLIALVAQIVPVHLIPNAYALTTTDTYLRLDRMRSSTGTTQPTTFRLVFKTPASDTGTDAKLQVQFYHPNNADPTQANNNFTINATQAVATTNCATEASNELGTTVLAVPGTLAASGDNAGSGATRKTITVTGLTNLSTSQFYCVDFTTSNAVTNPVNPNLYMVQFRTLTSADAVLDSKLLGVRIVDPSDANYKYDQITVTGVVPPSFSFNLSGNTDAFTALLDPAAVTYTTGRTVTISTNAAKGWIVWVKDSDQGLKSVSTPTSVIASTGTVSNDAVDTATAGTENFLLDVDMTTDGAGGGAVTIDPDYNGTASGEGGALSNTVFQQVAHASGTANGDVITLKALATITGSTPAGDDYTDVLTVIGAGNF
ncbi:MAG TPA: hypothetical protein VMR98_04370 [Candidatus Polarisedimenticolaceae bacterium]|nr:hypothetical protein [Candidatus Polarisedimenticolaceae bacterium]